MTVNINIIHGDGVKALEAMEENQYGLAIVDPEFGINIGNSSRLVKDKGLKAKDWDSEPIDYNYFSLLFVISKNQIIWGGNYYELPSNKHCLIWDKKQPEALSFGMFDYAWTSFEGANKMFRYSVTNNKNTHPNPTAKPIQLYKWLLKNYAKPGDKIIDTHGGSMSHAIAAIDMGFSLDIYEIDDDYYKSAVERIKRHVSQLDLSRPPCKINFITN